MDRVKVQVQFRKGVFTCKKCGNEDVVNWSMAGGNTYENNCSKCGEWNNDFDNYSGCIAYTPEEYEGLKAGDLDKKKDELVEKFIYDKKNPPPYVEPSKEDLEREKAELEARVSELNTKISEKTVEGKE